MAVLNDWQKISRVVPGKPFGNGLDGDYSSSTIPTMINEGCTPTKGSTSLPVGGTTISDNDIVMINATRGSGESTLFNPWEINKVVSGGGTTSLTLLKETQYDYLGHSHYRTQITVVKQYENATANGTWILPDWNGTTGGILVFAVDELASLNGIVNASGKGLRGGDEGGCNRGLTECIGFGTFAGEGKSSPSRCHSAFQNLSGGGAGWSEGPKSQAKNAVGGGGAGNGTEGIKAPNEVGTDNNVSCPAQEGGQGGTEAGTADLLDASMGAGGGTGGGRQGDVNNRGGKGGDGGGLIIIFAKDLVITGTITNNGENGGTFDFDGGGGGGAGGSTLFVVETATLGSNLINSIGGTGGVRGNYGGRGGIGGVGRVAVHHSKEITGTTNPTFTDIDDSSLVEQVGSLMGLVI